MKILISESQYKNIFEAMRQGFSVDYLTNAKSFNERVRYCREMLGMPIGNGSSRLVFQIDDETCLKLAKNKKGVAQNLEEISIARDGFISYIPKIYNGSDEENGLWVITQYVLPAEEKDFEQVLGIPFKDVANFADNTDDRFNYKRGNNFVANADKIVQFLYKKYEDNDDVIALFNDINDLKANYDQIVADLRGIQNWGMVRENGNTFMVMLDTGFSEEVRNQFYRRKI
jgi:hypothetical protein